MKEKMTNTYDVIIIGGGAGAFSAAIKANSLKAKTLMVNAGLPLGGTCVNVGCVPSKTLIHAAELIHTAKHHNVPGLKFDIKEADFAKVVVDEQALIEKMRTKKYKDVLVELENVTYLAGYASFVGRNTIAVEGEVFEAPKIIVATGSRTRIPDVVGLEEAGYITHVDAVALTKLPKSLAVIGAGAQGLEWGQMFSRFGVEVTILQTPERILPGVDEGAALRLQGILTSEGIDIVAGSNLVSVEVKDGKKHITYTVGEESKTLVIDEILLASGRTPNTDKLNVENAGVDLTDNGAVVVTSTFKTSNESIFAVGDVAALPLRQETTAGREGTFAAANALSGENNAIDYDTVPFAVFTSPQLAGVGLSEEEQMKRYNSCLCRTVQLDAVPKAGITRQIEGIFRISANPETEVIEGMTIVAPHASELIARVMEIVLSKKTIDEVTDTIPMFPTISEGINYAALAFKNDISKLSCCI